MEPMLLGEKRVKMEAAGFSSPLGLAYGNACVLDTGAYFFGRDSSNAYSKIYRINGTVITPVTTIPRARFGMRLVGYGKNIFVFGTGTSAEDRILQKYDVISNTWTNHLTYQKDFLWASVCQDGPYAYLTATGTARDDTEITRLDMSGDNVAISKYPATNVNRAHMLIASYGGNVYFGGGMTDVPSFSTFSDFYCLNLATGIQRRLQDIPEAGYFAMSYGRLRNKLIALNPLSGTNATTTATHSKKVLSFDFGREKWRYETETPVGINHSACYTFNSEFYRIGGRSQTTYYADCLKFS